MTSVFKREFSGYFRSPVAYVFLIIFLIASVGLAFTPGRFFTGNEASLVSYFWLLPWLFLFLIPAAGMRLWSEEKRSGTIELLFTLPITTLQAVLGKFLAAWAFISLAVLLSLPLALTAEFLGDPDWGIIFTSYVGALLMAAAYLSICSLMSALTKNQVISFVLSVVLCFAIMLLGWGNFTDLLNSFLPSHIVDTISNFSFTTHFDPFRRGIIDLRDVVYFVSLSIFALFLNVVALER